MKKNQYFLIERNKRVDEIHFLTLPNSWGSSLEEIDLYTTQFRNSEEFLGGPSDCFIIHHDQFGLHIQEALFQDSIEVVNLAKASLEGNLEKESNQIHTVLNTFCRKMEEDSNFYNKVMYQDTPLFTKFTDYFSNKRYEKNYSVKYQDGCWVQKSYPLLRNVVWAIHHLNDYYDQNEERLVNKEKMLIMTGEHYHPLQLPLFNFVDDEAFSQILEKKDAEVEYGYQKCKRRKGIN